MINIVNGKFFVQNEEGEMIQTSNAELIGLAMLDLVEENPNKIYDLSPDFKINKALVIENYTKYVSEKSNKLRMTWERKLLIEAICSMPNNFTPEDFVKEGMSLNVSYPTCYNFLKSVIDFGLITVSPKTYSFNPTALK